MAFSEKVDVAAVECRGVRLLNLRFQLTQLLSLIMLFVAVTPPSTLTRALHSRP